MVKTWLPSGLVGLVVFISLTGVNDKVDYAELSQLIQQAAADKCPKRIEDKSQWGRTVPIPPRLRLPRLQRTVVRVGDHDEFPDGTWRRNLVWFDDPAKDITVQVRDIKRLDANNFQVRLDAEAAFHGERERVQWKHGIKLFGLTVQADARIRAELDCRVKITFDSSKLPPVVLIEPRVAGLKLMLKDFDLNRVGRVLAGAPARELGDELKGVLQGCLTSHEKDIKERANQALVKALKGGPARIPATDLLKLKARVK